MAMVGGTLIYLDRRMPGTPAPVMPIALLIGGALVFGLVAAGSRRPPGTGGTRPVERFPNDFALPRGTISSLVRGLGVAAVTAGVYAVFGYSPLVLGGWIAAMVLAGESLAVDRRPTPAADRLGPGEWAFLAAVVAGLACLLLPHLASMPYEFSTDEIYSTATVRDFQSGRERDPFGLVQWWGLPAMWFAVAGLTAHAVGASIESMRLVSALTGLAAIVPLYVWVRAVLGRGTARLATLLFAFGNAYIAWGRIALHQNSPVLVLCVALALLAVGLRDRCPLRVFLGGIALGLGFHTYPSGQILLFIWAAVLVAAVVTGSASIRSVGAVGALSGFGALLAIGPMLVTISTSWSAFLMRARAIAISNPEAVERLGVMLRVDPGTAASENTIRAMLSFNGPYPYVTYTNPGNGFVDPVMGVLLWLGLALALARPHRLGTLVCAIGFAAVYTIGFLTEGAPVHGRLLVALPFVAALGAVAVRRIGVAIAPGEGGAVVRRRLGIAFAAGFIALNLGIYRNYVGDQITRGRNDEVTAIGRSMGVGVASPGPMGRFLGREPRWDPNTLAVLVTGEDNPVFDWADEKAWRDWMAFFSDPSAVVVVPDVASFTEVLPTEFRRGGWSGAVLFMRTDAWNRERDLLYARYPNLTHRTITDSRRLIEVRVAR